MRARRRRARGSSLIEVMVAMAIIMIMMVGVLEMFSLSLLQNHGSAERTQLTYKAQQIVDTIRLSQYMGKQASPKMAASAGIAYPIADTLGLFKALPYSGTELTYGFWGPPPGLNVIEKPNDRYRLFYKVASASLAVMNVTVVAIPADSLSLTSGSPSFDSSFGVTNAPTDGRYLGTGSKLKRVDYVAQIPSPN
jgi:hypothetical protein